MVMLDSQLSVLPAVNGAVAAVLIHQANVLKDVPLLVVGFENRFVLIDLAWRVHTRSALR